MANKDMNGNDFFEQDLDVMLQEYLAKEEAEKQRKERALLESSHTAQMNLDDVNRLLGEMNLNDLFVNESPQEVREDEHDLDVILRAYGDDNRSATEPKTQVLSAPNQISSTLSRQQESDASYADSPPENGQTRVFADTERPASPTSTLRPEPDSAQPKTEVSTIPPSPPQVDLPPTPVEKPVVAQSDPPVLAPSPQQSPQPRKSKSSSKPLKKNPSPIDLSATTTIPTLPLNGNIYDTQVVPDLPDAMKKIKPHKRSRFAFRNQHDEDHADTTARSGLYVSLGIIMTVLALIGIVGLSLVAIQQVQEKMNQTKVKQEWNQQVFPLVASDVPDFDMGAGQVPSDHAILSAGIWAFILSQSNANYDTNEQGMLTVPALDIELHIKKIFGPEISFTHQSLQEPNLQVEYRPLDDIGKGVYLIPATPPTSPYEPNTIEVVEETATQYRITVSYMRPVPFVPPEELFKTGEVLKKKTFTYAKPSENDRFVMKVEPAP